VEFFTPVTESGAWSKVSGVVLILDAYSQYMKTFVKRQSKKKQLLD